MDWSHMFWTLKCPVTRFILKYTHFDSHCRMIIGEVYCYDFPSLLNFISFLNGDFFGEYKGITGIMREVGQPCVKRVGLIPEFVRKVFALKQLSVEGRIDIWCVTSALKPFSTLLKYAYDCIGGGLDASHANTIDHVL